MKKLISIVTPFYNEEEAINSYFSSLNSCLEKITNINFEFVAIDDGSADQTFELLKKAAQKYQNVKVLKLSRNFGKEAALSAGIDHAFGDAVIPLDADLQDDPSVIVQMIEKWQEGNKIVLARRIARNDSFVKDLTAKIFYKLAGKIMERSLPADVGDFRLMDKMVVDEVRKMREKNRFMRGIFSWVGFKTAYVDFARPKRKEGKAKQNYLKVTKYALDGIFSFSNFPLRLISYFGFILSFCSFCYLIFIIFSKLFFHQSIPGYPSIMSVVLFVSGINFIFLGVIGQYIGRIFSEVKGRPIYIIEEKID